ncbi:carbamoyl-phosphate synthase small subunit [Syntrophobotulus glycolicus DSM 8271]|uniref:Carbamoyl phosphate synthase small chain n=1 Tax=Syntrophobotulus glycolicus (strain DSM 8271 / FlGlyR) TaxID=645991 RepID=F0SY49_SYNGF|nr:glutamine-hydrolyzing carbamoyl-phosphate synthase small subunit [Syntrophobotulus glycolicus]ADY54799.1 carbamoyl-phosphate synthase small subunit [Syntrophobotulus glycolicus DSM 8271]
MQCALVLETGKVFCGESFGAVGEAKGEIVFNTGMTGYQEVLTDPSYADQIVCMTYPLIGNYGINAEDDQSGKIQVRGFIVKEAAASPNHWQMQSILSKKLAQSGIVGIMGIDTRALTRHIREHGVLKGLITNHLHDLEKKASDLKDWHNTRGIVAEVSTDKSYIVPSAGSCPRKFRVVAMDFGIKGNILETMSQKGFEVTVVPYHTKSADILAFQPDGVFLSNGPGDPKDVPQAIETIKELAGKTPVFGICLGHQLLALALGGDTYKLKFGHRGGNQPVQDLRTGRVTITSQNHGYAVSEKSLANTLLQVTQINLNDKTIEGLAHSEWPLFSVQYHPEAGPGPSDSLYLFDRFARLMEKGGSGYGA